MRWLCTACQVEWSSPGVDHGPCWNCETVDHVQETFEVPSWAMGYTHLQAWYRDRRLA